MERRSSLSLPCERYLFYHPIWSSTDTLFERDGALVVYRWSSSRGISSFQAFSLAISGRVGTGNIAGVATAIAMGGPGAIFWMWVIAFLGSSSAIVEATLGQMYKEVKDGQYRGGGRILHMRTI